MPGCEGLRFRAVGRQVSGRRSRPIQSQLPGELFPRRLFLVAHAAPPRVASCIRVLSPALFNLIFVVRVVETVEHLFSHELRTSTQ